MTTSDDQKIGMSDCPYPTIWKVISGSAGGHTSGHKPMALCMDLSIRIESVRVTCYLKITSLFLVTIVTIQSTSTYLTEVEVGIVSLLDRSDTSDPVNF